MDAGYRAFIELKIIPDAGKGQIGSSFRGRLDQCRLINMDVKEKQEVCCFFLDEEEEMYLYNTFFR